MNKPTSRVVLLFLCLLGIVTFPAHSLTASSSTRRDEGFPHERRAAEAVVKLLANLKVIDLTHPLNDNSRYHPAFVTPLQEGGFKINTPLPVPGGDKLRFGSKDTGFKLEPHATCRLNVYYENIFWCCLHVGTHVDAPADFRDAAGRPASQPTSAMTVDDIPLDRLVCPAAIIDITKKAKSNADYRLTKDDIIAWELQNGKMPRNSLVVLRSGWDRRWDDAERYYNKDAEGIMHYPGFSEDAAEFLVAEREICGIGTDTLCVDYGRSSTFPVHRLICKAGKYIVESLANLGQLPATGTTLFVAPVKVEGAPAAPARVYALNTPGASDEIAKLLNEYVMIDLTYPLNKFNHCHPKGPGIEVMPVDWPLPFMPKSIKILPGGVGFSLRGPRRDIMRSGEHTGTHIDAPAHFKEGADTIEKVSPANLICPAVVIDVTERADVDNDYLLSPFDILLWEKNYGRIPENAFVIMYTGWGKRWGSEKRFYNRDITGTLHHPGFSAEASKMLVNERNIRGIGIDTLSLDHGPTLFYPTHHLMCNAGKYMIENMSNLSAMPPSGAVIFMAPMKIERGSGSPTRVIALGPKDKAKTEKLADPLKLSAKVEGSYKPVKDYTTTFLKTERVKGKMTPVETIFLKFKKPKKIYMKWIKDPHKGRETLYVEGKYDNKLLVHESGLLGLLPIDLDPTSSVAKGDNRHPITEAGIGYTIELMVKDWKNGANNNEIKIIDHGTVEVAGVTANKFEAIKPKEKEKAYYCHRTIVYLDEKTGIPIKILNYGSDDQLIEHYTYADLKINVGLTEKDFDKNNNKYGFW